MIEKIFVRDLIIDTFIDSPFLLQAYQVKQKKNGEDFLSLTLKDKSGEVQAVVWDRVLEAIEELSSGDYVQISGKVGQYNDKIQITAQRIIKLEANDVREEDYVPATEKDIMQMWNELKEVINSIEQPQLQRLLLDIFNEPAFSERFSKAPAAKGHHHTFIGGLLEHTLSIVKLCEMVANHYTIIDRDLLITGGILHDIAKIEELSYDRNYDYTDEGRLLGHIVMAAVDLDRRMRKHEFPDKLRIQVIHMIISHHGEEEYGSPRKPMIPEALALHYIDMLDTRMEMVRAARQNAQDLEGSFTSYHKGLERFIFKG